MFNHGRPTMLIMMMMVMNINSLLHLGISLGKILQRLWQIFLKTTITRVLNEYSRTQKVADIAIFN